MRRYRLKFSEDMHLEFTSASLHEIRKSYRQYLLKALSWIGVVLLSGVILLSPFSFQMERSAIQQPYSFLVVAVLFIALFAGMVILTGSKVFVDPPIFVPILLFALFIITAFLIVPLPEELASRYRGANTFGTSPMWYLGGVFVMGFTLFYYLVSSFISSKGKYKVVVNALVAGFIIITCLVLVDTILVDDLINLLTVGMLALTGYLISGKAKYLVYLTVPLLAAGLIVIFQPGTNPFLILALLAILTLLILIWLVIRNFQIPNPIFQLKNELWNLVEGENDIREFTSKSGLSILLIVWLIYFILTVLWLLSNNVDIGYGIRAIFEDYRYSIESISAWPNWLIGTGIVSGVGETTFSSIIKYQGLVGIVSYLLLGISAVWLGLRCLRKEMNGKKGESFTLGLAAIVFTVPVIGFVTRLGFMEVAVWWLALGLLSAGSILPSAKKTYDVLKHFQFFRLKIDRGWSFIQLLLLFGVFILVLFTLPLLATQFI